MVGLVVVSHSRALAYAAEALAKEMVHDRPVAIEVAAGLDETTFGTDAAAIATAITKADSGDGVVVLMDLGSAVLSAELALELIETGSDRVLLCPAPLVEGLIAAAVTAATGGTRQEVAGEASAALVSKQAHFGTPPETTPESMDAGPSASFTVTNAHGLHARPAARLVSAVKRFDAHVQIRNRSNGSPWAPAGSLSRVATLGALQGHEVEVRASGRQAREAVDQVVALATRAFDEDEAEDEGTTAADDAGTKTGPGNQGQPASPGIAIGPAWHAKSAPLDFPDVPAQDPATEWRRIEEALAVVQRDLQRIRGTEATIFDAHLLLLEDADLVDDVRTRIEHHSPAPKAWQEAIERVTAEFEALADPYLKARAADVRAVGEQVLRALLGVSPAMAQGEGVLIAHDLTPAEAAQLHPERVTGILLAFGSPLSHAAIIARTRGIPAVMNLGPAVLDVPAGTPVALDGSTGEVRIEPDDAVLASFRKRANEVQRHRKQAIAPAVTQDGIRIAVGANIGSVMDARAAEANGADMAGLVRTEFLFLDRAEAPDVDEQETAYRAIAQALGGMRITIRTLDVGGDKQLTYLPRASERGIRHSLRHPRLFADQLAAIVRVARDTPVSVMFPMVATVDEFLSARRILDDVMKHEPPGLRVGIMVEVPAAALKAAAFAKHVDFFSVGTNDLTQYALAAERETTAPGDALDPGVLRLIDAVCRGAGNQIPVSVCGELAGDETAVPLLIGLGVRELSVVPPAVPAIKEAVRATDLDRATALVAQALELNDAGAVRRLLTMR